MTGMFSVEIHPMVGNLRGWLALHHCMHATFRRYVGQEMVPIEQLWRDA